MRGRKRMKTTEILLALARRSSEEKIAEMKTALHAAEYLPGENETAAVAIGLEKTAALFYDRIWSPFEDIVPPSIHFCGNTMNELVHLLCVIDTVQKEPSPSDLNITRFFLQTIVSGDHVELVGTLNDMREGRRRSFIRMLTDTLAAQCNIHAVPVYRSESARERDFHNGDHHVVISILEHLPLPIEEELPWEQITELRLDEEAKWKLRKLHHWLSRDMVGKPVEFIVEHIAITLHEYEKSLRKHGIKTALATTAGVLGAVSLPTIISQLTAQPFWISLIQGVLIGGSTVAKVVEKHLDSRPEAPGEVAWVYDLKRRL